MPRPSWKGFIRLSLVSVPVEGYTASATSTSQVALNQLHKDCGERIRYKKTCPIHGEVAPHPNPETSVETHRNFAKFAYKIADAMILERKAADAAAE